MILYQFACDACGIRWEDFCRADAPKAASCPACDAPGRRQFSAPTINPPSFGRDLYAARTPEHAKRPKNADDERKYHAQKRELGITSRPVTKG